jgi:hypothetical protein
MVYLWNFIFPRFICEISFSQRFICEISSSQRFICEISFSQWFICEISSSQWFIYEISFSQWFICEISSSQWFICEISSYCMNKAMKLPHLFWLDNETSSNADWWCSFQRLEQTVRLESHECHSNSPSFWVDWEVYMMIEKILHNENRHYHGHIILVDFLYLPQPSFFRKRNCEKFHQS